MNEERKDEEKKKQEEEKEEEKEEKEKEDERDKQEKEEQEKEEKEGEEGEGEEQKDEKVKKKLRLENFQMNEITELDYLDLANLKIGENENVDLNLHVKNYIHYLFTPILVYSISFLNKTKNSEVYKDKIGIETLRNYKVLYTTLNEEMYDLFFLKEKKKLIKYIVVFQEIKKSNIIYIKKVK